MKTSPGPIRRKNLFLLSGREELLKEEQIRKLRESHLSDPSASDLNYQEFRAERDRVHEVLDFLQTLPFLGGSRMAVLRDVDYLEEDEKKALLRYLEAPSGSSVLVLVAAEATPKKNSFLKKLSELGTAVSCYAPFERELPAWVLERSRRMGKAMDREAAACLIERTGGDLTRLLGALELLVLFTHPRDRIAARDVEACLGKSLEADVFRLWDWILEEKPVPALELLAGLFREGTRAFEITAVLATQFEKMRRSRVLCREGLSPEEAAVQMKVHPFYQKKFAGQIRIFSDEKNRVFSRALLRCDEAVKKSRLDERTALERLVLETAGAEKLRPRTTSGR